MKLEFTQMHFLPLRSSSALSIQVTAPVTVKLLFHKRHLWAIVGVARLFPTTFGATAQPWLLRAYISLLLAHSIP